MTETVSSFPIPVSLQDLERDPYNLLPYPYDFNDVDDAARADSFAALVDSLHEGNTTLCSANMQLFYPDEDTGSEERGAWLSEERLQALYTLVRKSTSLEFLTRQRLVNALSDAVNSLSTILKSCRSDGCGETAPQSFRDTFACHVYMLYSFMFLLESDAKGSNKVSEQILAIREVAVEAMLNATEAMASCRTTLWLRGVPDEAVVMLPCRIAYPMLELATGVLARKASCSDKMIRMIATTIDAYESSLSTVSAALMDLMHSFDHMATLTAELCTIVSEQPVNRLAVELLREIGRLEGDDGKAAGIKNIAPFISELAFLRPRLVHSNILHLLPHLDSEPYNLRSSIVTAISHILVFLAKYNDSLDATEVGKNTTEQVLPMQNNTKSQAALILILKERVHDISSYTRATSIKAWIRLLEEQAVPKEIIIDVARLAMDRLQDKTVVVRKQSMVLLTKLLENNPFMGNLDPKPYRRKLQEMYDYVMANLPIHIQEIRTNSIDRDDERNSAEVENATLAAAIAEADQLIEDSSQDVPVEQQEYCRNVQVLKFTQAALEFIDVFEGATTALEGMLLSANASDVTEALHFFVQARYFKLPCAVSGMKRALALMWSTEKVIRDEVLRAFVEVFVAVPGSDGSQFLPDDDISMNLLVLIDQSSLSDMASIEEAIVHLVKQERLPPSLFTTLWVIFTRNPSVRAPCIQLLAMGAAADRTIIDSKSRLMTLLEVGLLECTQNGNDWMLANAVALALQRLGRTVIIPDDAKFLVLEQIMNQLCIIVSGETCVDEDLNDTLRWFSASEQAVKALFVICPEPETICNRILTGMIDATFKDISDECHSMKLARFFHVLGEIALNLLVYTEALISNVRRGTAKRSTKMQEEVGAKLAKSKLGTNANIDEDTMENELGMAAAAEAENERKLVDISENEILGRGLISLFVPLLVRVVGNDSGVFNSEVLAQASTLALCKFMCVSSSFCEKHLPLLFTALSNAPPGDITMRANTVVALGDVAFRFPNEFEPYTHRLYGCLRDSSTKVRRHALMVLTHLILNDMVKVKGQVCEIAICLRDDDTRIMDMARLLFHELSKRSNNPIYNLLPDMISQLGQLSLGKDDFRHIMTFLFSFIKKERQFEMLTEKLCYRFTTCTTMSQKADLAFCISLIKMNEKCMKCLSDNFKLYKDSLFDADVMKSFTAIVTKAKKFMKPEMREFIEEWEGKLVEFSSLGVENLRTDANATNLKDKVRKKKNSKKTKQLRESIEEELNIEDDTVVDNDDKENSFHVKPHRSTRKGRSAAFERVTAKLQPSTIEGG